MSIARQGRQPRARGGRQVVRKVRVTVRDNARLEALAATQCVSVPRLLVEAALAGDGWTPTQRRALARELAAMRRDVEGIGTNVNQLARWANTTERFPRDAARVLDVIGAAVERLDGLVAELRSA